MSPEIHKWQEAFNSFPRYYYKLILWYLFHDSIPYVNNDMFGKDLSDQIKAEF
jgi:hypothetical protein